ncbi:hypothetical protein [Rufibacter quisquiliarum]|uniref:Uncharacterized protein n=1 Tax=Rufibacter quisquiliarum TaxID=1549639 RepID=A0A839GRR3_9BACT|nr:hypothetical protein [Rufibacter quisquiliarum]MBA9078195.1 hypothetical protein [Rufibacter quisquiliarum]
MWEDYEMENQEREYESDKELFLELYKLNDLVIIGSRNENDWCEIKQEFIIKEPDIGAEVEYTYRSISLPEFVLFQAFHDWDDQPNDFIVFKFNLECLEGGIMKGVCFHPEVYDRQIRKRKIDMVLNHPTKT